MAAKGTDFPISDTTMPVIFVGHGSPMNALEDNEFCTAWVEAAAALPRPRAILCISAHWQTCGSALTGMDAPRTIHDFGGFPRALFEMQYPAPGSPALASLVKDNVKGTVLGMDTEWGLDHGTWSVLARMFPKADIPVVQLSLDYALPPVGHYRLARELRFLRQRGVLVVGSGNIVHNLGLVRWEGGAFGWAVEFDEKMKQLIVAGDHVAIINYDALGRSAQLSIPTNEHFLPLLYVLALQDKGEPVQFFAEKVTYGSLSMRSVRIG